MFVTPPEALSLAHDFVQAFDARDEAALQRLNTHYRRSFTFDDLAAEVWRRVYAHRQRSFRGEPNRLLLTEAQTLVAQDAGYPSWSSLLDGIATGTPAVPAFAIDTTDNCISPRRQLADADWDSLIAAMTEHRVAALDAGGLMTDAALARIAKLSHVTSLSLGGSRQLTDEGLHHLAAMPQLEHLSLSGAKITDRGLAVLAQLPSLRTFELNWQRGISDAGVAHLATCERLERVDLMGSPVGDEAMAALRGKSQLREFKSGRLVTDRGIGMLQEFPAFRDGREGTLLLDGPFTNDGLATLAGLAGITALDLFWHATSITSDAFAHLTKLPNLRALGADGALSDDRAMQHYAAMPALRKLRAQEAAATDAGFEALGRSTTLESFWGRECEHFGDRGFLAFARLGTLRELGVGCRNVSDAALSAFPDFPSLQSVTPIGVKDDGFRYIGQCRGIGRLTCMYCRDTTDVATAHIADLPLRYYYAGLTQITDRSLEILGRITTLEQVEFYEVNGLTDAGLPFLASLPRLREAAFDSLPGVTLEGTRVFAPHVRVRYST